MYFLLRLEQPSDGFVLGFGDTKLLLHSARLGNAIISCDGDTKLDVLGGSSDDPNRAASTMSSDSSMLGRGSDPLVYSVPELEAIVAVLMVRAYSTAVLGTTVCNF